MEKHGLSPYLMRIVDTYLTCFQGIIGEINRDQHPLGSLFPLWFGIRLPSVILDHAQRMRQIALLDPYTHACRNNRLYLVHILDVNLYSLCLKNRFEDHRLLIGVNR